MMKPYFQDDAVAIYHGDCREVFDALHPNIEDGVDIVITDPPYNIGFNGYGEYKDNLTPEAYTGLLSILNRFQQVVITHYPEETMNLVIPALGPPAHVGAWCYNAQIPRRFRLINYFGLKPDYSRIKRPYLNPSDARIQARVASGSEGADMYEWWDDIQLVKNVSTEKTDHPCPLPEKLVRRIITIASNGGDVILDPFMGSGTTLRAAKDLGRKAIGIEIEERYCEIAAKRMSQGVLL